MTNRQRYVIRGEPRAGKNSQRIAWRKAKSGARVPYIKKSRAAAAWILEAARQLAEQRLRSRVQTFRDPVRVTCDVFQSAAVPDLDNSLNLVSDALQESRVIENDSLIVEINARKFVNGSEPRVEVTIIPL